MSALTDLADRTDGWAGLEALHRIAGEIEGLNVSGLDDLVAMIKDTPPDDARDSLALLLALIDQSAADLLAHRNTVERTLLDLLEYNEPTPLRGMDGWSVRKMGGSARKSWQHDDLGNIVAQVAAVDPATGDMPTERLAFAKDVVAKVLAAAAPSYWRVGVLKSYGIQPDNYCEKSKGRYSVQVQRPEPVLFSGTTASDAAENAGGVQ